MDLLLEDNSIPEQLLISVIAACTFANIGGASNEDREVGYPESGANFAVKKKIQSGRP
jgi:hypothetical protein